MLPLPTSSAELIDDSYIIIIIITIKEHL